MSVACTSPGKQCKLSCVSQPFCRMISDHVWYTCARYNGLRHTTAHMILQRLHSTIDIMKSTLQDEYAGPLRKASSELRK